MSLQDRRADVVWEGNLLQGKGQITVPSGALGTLPVSWSARTENPNGMTSPEELIAAAQAACYAMAFSATLTRAGHIPERLNVAATCSLNRKPEGGVKITDMLIEVTGKVPGLSAAEFERLAQEGEKGCPVANALRNNVDIKLKAKLES